VDLAAALIADSGSWSDFIAEAFLTACKENQRS
jgi:hypothetical protein